jgi:hypothetical protein
MPIIVDEICGAVRTRSVVLGRVQQGSQHLQRSTPTGLSKIEAGRLVLSLAFSMREVMRTVFASLESWRQKSGWP